MLKIYSKISKKQIGILLVDLLIIWISIKLGHIIRLGYGSVVSLGYIVSNLFIYVITFYIGGLYDFKTDFRRKKVIVNLVGSIGAGTLAIIFFFYYIFLYIENFLPLGRGVLVIQTIFVFLGILAWRILYSKVAMARIFRKKALILGCGNGGRGIARLINQLENPDIEIVGFLDIKKEREGKIVEGYKVFWQEGPLKDSVAEMMPDMLVIAMRSERYKHILKDLTWCSQNGIEIEDMTSLFEKLGGRIPLKYIDDSWILFSSINRPRMYFRRIKRLIDIIVSAISLLISLPLTIPVAIAIKIFDKGDIFYRQKRIGESGREFKFIKFRSMVQDADKENSIWVRMDEDKRITKIGRFIRKWHIDEIPQLLNVLKGDMSVVGPRPEKESISNQFLKRVPVNINERTKVDSRDYFGNYHEKIPYYAQRLSVKPGITGWAQVMYPYASSFEQTAEKLEYDMYYLKNMSLALDMAIILKTIRVVLLGKGK